jgi:hypothetical protein
MKAEIKMAEPKRTKYEAKSHGDINLSIYANEEPIAIRIVRSGWSKPQMYHVLIEFGDYGDTTYKGLMDGDQIKESYGVIMPEELSLSDINKKYPNDQDFGKILRKLNRDAIQKTEI